MAKAQASTSFTAERQVKKASLRVKNRTRPVTNEDLAEAIYGLREEIADIIGKAAARVEAEPKPAAQISNNDALLEQMSELRSEIGEFISASPARDGAPAAPESDGLIQEISALRADLSTIVADAVANAAPASLADETWADEPATQDDKFNAQDVRLEIAQMVRTIARAKNEIAAISQPTSEDDDRLDRASNELDAIVAATESATRDILMANEQIGALVDEVATIAGNNAEVAQRAEKIAELLITIFEACSFQDITGQRITKVVRTLQFIQDRILAMIEIWGIEAFADLPVSLPGHSETDDESKLLNGPQLENEGITQAEIDALFD